jgi:branched-chain amino acid transport system permease protein
MALFFQQIINSISIGGIYALMSVGYALIYSLLMFTNFAHSLSVTVGAYLTFVFLTKISGNLYLGIIFGILMGALASLIIEITAYRSLLMRNSKRSFLTIIGMGVSTIGLNLIIIIFSSRFKVFPTNFKGELIQVFGASLSTIDVVIIVTSAIALIAVQLFINKTRLGLAIRASSHDLDTAALMGVDVNKLLTTVFVIAGALAGLAGALLGAKYQAYPNLGASMTNKAFISSVVGGLGSLPGAVLGSFVLSTGEVMISGYVSSTLRDVFAYVLLVVILLVRPVGLMGKRFDDKA